MSGFCACEGHIVIAFLSRRSNASPGYTVLRKWNGDQVKCPNPYKWSMGKSHSVIELQSL